MRPSNFALTLVLASFAALAPACAGDDGGSGASASSTDAGSTGEASATDASTTAAATGTVLFRFSVPAGVRESPNLMSPLVGTIYGSIFLSEDVTVTGPIDGATEWASVEVAGVDLQAVDVAAATWTSAGLPPGMYTFLGFYDLNGNGPASYEPDAGDAVTLPSVNKFTIAVDQQAEVTITFDLVLG